VSSVPVTLGGERLAHVCLMDVTERTRGEQRYQLLIDHMLNGIALCRMIFDGDRPVDFAYEMVNPAFEKQTGLVDVAGKAVSEVIPGILERDPELFEIYGRVVKTGTPEHFELYLESLKMWFEVSVFRPQQGYFAAVFDVVTERKQAEEALRRSENKYRTLLENLSQRIFLKDRESVYVSCNESYARDLGIRADEIAGRTDFDFYPRGLAEKYRGDDQRLMHEGKTEDLEERYLLDGQERWVHTIKTPVRDATGNVTGILGIYWDITRRSDSSTKRNGWSPWVASPAAWPTTSTTCCPWSSAIPAACSTSSGSPNRSGATSWRSRRRVSAQRP
jgi:PAS domain S-box-containing protein